MFQIHFQQLRVLLWKSLIIRRVHYISTIFELISPLLLICVITFISSNTGANSNGETVDGSLVGPVKYRNPKFTITFDDSKDFPVDPMYTIFYAPGNDFTRKLVKQFTASPNSKVSVIPFSTEDILREELQKAMENQLANKEIIGIHFSDNFTNDEFRPLKSGQMSYQLIMPASREMLNIMHRKYPVKYSQTPVVGPSDFQLPPFIDQYKRFTIVSAYLSRQFTHQICITYHNQSNTNCDQYRKPLSINQMPYPRYHAAKTNAFSLPDFVSICFPLSYIVIVSLIVKRITDEKSGKTKELLRLIGLSDFVYWTGHFVSHFVVITFHGIVFTIILFAFKWSIFTISSPIIFFIGFLLFGAQAILFAMLITTVLNRPIIATIVSTILWLTLSATIFYNLVPSLHPDAQMDHLTSARVLTSFTPCGSIIWFISIMGSLENYGIGLGFSTLGTPSRAYGQFTAVYVLLIMLLSNFVYVFLIWYLDQVWPLQQYGVAKVPWFIFKPSYWRPNKCDENEINETVADNNNNSEFTCEPTTSNTKPSIQIINISKIFNTNVVVDRLSMKMYENEITILLGPNSAGKTTTMNMIAGIYPPESGSILVNGFDVATQTREARQSMGLCTQENIFFNELTVGQHLRVFGLLKGCSPKLIDAQIDAQLHLLQLSDKKDLLAPSLSGGMKRKLSLGIALVGGTKVLILDEPTTGLDPDSRRAVWDVLLNVRKERTILMTTHYMEEADILADRIAILNNGKLSCHGRPNFLKKAFGAGYRLRVAKQPHFDSANFTRFLHAQMPTATLKTETNTEIVFSLNNTEIDKAKVASDMATLFGQLEQDRHSLAIDCFGLSYATLEDVFIAASTYSCNSTLNVNTSSNDVEVFEHAALSTTADLISGPKLLAIQMYALLLKRFQYALRYWPMIVFQLLIPSLFIAIGMLCGKAGRYFEMSQNNAQLNLNISQIYGPNTETFFYGSQNYFDSYQAINSKRYNAVVNYVNSTNLTSAAIDEWILDRVHGNIDAYIAKYLYGFGVDESEFKSWVNFEQYHSLPLSIGVIYDSMLGSVLPAELKPHGKIRVDNVALISTNEVQTMQILSELLPWALSCLVFMPIAFPFLAASFVLLPVTEQASKSKLLQLMTGLSPAIYWMANFLFDLFNHIAAITCLYAVIYWLDFEHIFFLVNERSQSAGTALYVLLLSFGVAVIPQTYVASYFFSKPSNAFATLISAFILIGFIGNIIFSVLDLLINYFQLEYLSKPWYSFFLLLFRLMPIFSLLFGYQKMHKLSSLSNVCSKNAKLLNELCVLFDFDPVTMRRKNGILVGCCANVCKDKCYTNTSPFAVNEFGSGVEIMFMLLTGFVSLVAIILFEIYKQQICKFITQFSLSELISRKILQKPPPMPKPVELPLKTIDCDVLAERARIQRELQKRGNDASTCALIVAALSKKYDKLTAVNELTFGIAPNECFGLIGANGAGKTTTFSMLTGDLWPSKGNAFIEQVSLIEQLRKYQTSIGYCPQFDALLDKLTGEETLRLFARLRGIPPERIARDVHNLIKMVGLGAHAAKVAQHYSGGNRRKLSIAIALVATPAILLLDEPNSGVDPVARHKIWQTLSRVKSKCSILLSSHLMDECETLCSRIGIMAEGQLRCIGSVQHLKSKFGQGYSMCINLARLHLDNSSYVTSVQREMSTRFPSSTLKDHQRSSMHYHITDCTQPWSAVFEQMSQMNETFQFDDFYVTDAKLEQVFLMFAQKQK